MAKDFIFSPGTKYTCINCGRCCTNWGISVENPVAEALEKYNWGAKYPEMRGSELMVRRQSPVVGESFFMKMRKDGRCPFLDERNFCRIHSELGYDAKPLTCKRFPLELIKGRRAVYARLSFYCPAVARGEGQPLGAQRRWMETCLRGGGVHSLPDEMYWAEGLKLSSQDASEIEAHLLDIIKLDRPFAERLALGAALIEAAGTYVEEKGKSAGNYMKEIVKLDYDPIEAEVRNISKGSSKGRLAIGLFLLQDSKPTAVARMIHLPSIVKFVLHVGAVKSHILGVKASFGKAKKVSFEPLDPEHEALLVRFYEHKIMGKRLLEGDMPLIGVWNLLCAAYRIVDLMSRVRAAHAGREAVDISDLREAVGLADLLAAEHTLLLRMDTSRRMIHMALSQPGVFKEILAPI